MFVPVVLTAFMMSDTPMTNDGDSKPGVERQTACDRRGLFGSRYKIARRRTRKKQNICTAPALMDGAAPALTARRRTRKRDMAGGGYLFKDRNGVYMTTLLRIACSLHP